MLPLYDDAQSWEGQRREPNLGLEYDKFFAGWDIENSQVSVGSEAKRAFYGHFVNDLRNYQPGLLKDYRERRHRLLFGLGGRIFRAKTSWRFVSGLGAAHPLETGFIWHRTLGVPYLPASSIKGMVRAWLVYWLKDKDRANRLFGDTDTAGIGRLMILEALPESNPKLEVDIMNPHYSDYYSDPKNPPADYYPPKPINFLTVSAGQWFEFALAPVQGRGTADDLSQGAELLQEALAILGCGGKTAVGYGAFEDFQDKTEELFAPIRRQAEEAILAKLSPVERQLRQLELALKKGQPVDKIKQATMDLFWGIDDLSPEDKVLVARTLKKTWVVIGEWDGKLSDKQVEKIAKVKGLLGEEGHGP